LCNTGSEEWIAPVMEACLSGPTWGVVLTIENMDFAVLLNTHAKGVNDKVLEELGEIVPPENLFLSRTVEESEAATEEILERGFGTVFTGGGDGTVVHFINQVMGQSAGGSITPDNVPKIGILRLGTGNALAEMVSSGSYLCDIKAFVRNNHRDYQLLPLVESEGRRFPFAGIGWDAEVLNDYVLMKTRVKGTPWARLFENVGGYFAAFFGRTAPRKVAGLFHRAPTYRIINTGGPATFVGPDGEVLKTFQTGEVLFDGKANCVMLGTCPYYGYGMKILPYANVRPDAMNLRVVTMRLPKVLANLRPIWQGRYRGDDIADFMVERVRVEISKEMPYQEAGDAMGYRDRIDFSVSSTRVNLLRFI